MRRQMRLPPYDWDAHTTAFVPSDAFEYIYRCRCNNASTEVDTSAVWED